MSGVLVGTCGWSDYDVPEGWQERHESKLAAYADAYGCVEVNRTFYALPRPATAERWRREAGEGFVFAVKAWQAVTHPISSPTWRDHDDALREAEREQVGYLEPNETVLEAWDATVERATAMDADAVLVQTPPSFGPEYADRVRAFVEAIDRQGLTLAWEPRGEWADHPDAVGDLCRDLDLVHVVDPLAASPRDDADVAYCRLHGAGGDFYHEYEDVELDALADGLRGLAEDRERVYCLFNNVSMHADAARLRERLGKG